MERVAESVCVFDTDTVARWCNAACERMLGVSSKDLCGHSLGVLAYEEDVGVAEGLFREAAAGEGHATAVIRFRVGAHEIRRIRWSVVWDQQAELFYGVAWDVTRKQLWQTRYMSATEASPTALIMVDAEGSIVLANEAALELLDYQAEQLLGQRVECLVPEGLSERHPSFRQAFGDRPVARPMGRGRDLAVRRKDGELVPVEIGLNPVRVDEEVHTVASLVDLRERKRAEAEIQTLARELEEANQSLHELVGTDELTGLWSRRKFFEEAEALIKLLRGSGGPLSLIMADIDWFKDFNDRFGHLVGDEVLRRVGEVLAATRSGSDFAARYGGEEFVVALPGSDAEQATAMAERLRGAVAELSWEGEPITISLGVATLTDPGERGADVGPVLDGLIDAADKALYRSKAAGKNCVTHAEAGTD